MRRFSDSASRLGSDALNKALFAKYSFRVVSYSSRVAAISFFGDLLSWRYAVALCIPFTAATLVMSGKLKPVPPLPGTKIDLVGVVLAASAIILISFGFNNLNRWGLAMSGPNAPFSILGLSPAPVMIVLGVIGMQMFVAWTQRREAAKLTPLL